MKTSVLARVHSRLIRAATSSFCLLTISALPAQTIALDKVEVVAPAVVSGTTVDSFSGRTTTVEADQLGALNAQDLTSALRRTPGVTIARYNPIGSFGGGEGGAILLRGLGSSRPGSEIKTTVDGVPKYNATFNHPLIDLLSIDLAARIEVAHRAAPLAAGNMFAGINLVSPRTTQSGSFARATVAAGSFGMFTEKAEAGAKSGAFDAYLGQSYRDSDGHRSDSAGRLANYVLRLGWVPNPHWSFDYLLNHTDNRASDPGPLGVSGALQTRGDMYQTADWLQIATATWNFDRAAGSLKLYRGDATANWLRRASSGNADSLNESQLSGVRWREILRPWDGGEIIAGADYDLMRGESVAVPANAAASTLTFGPREFYLFSAYTGVAQRVDLKDGWLVTPSAGIRYYDHDVFSRAWAPQAGMVGRHGGTQFHVSYGRALNFPGLDVAAFATVAIPALGQSWTALRPEIADQYEAGVRQELAPDIAAELTVFRNRGRDRYVFIPPPPPPFRYANVETFRTEGAELTVSARPNKMLSLFGGISRLKVTPADLPYAPRWSLVGGGTWRPVAPLTVNVDASYTGEQHTASQARSASTGNLERVVAFALLNARMSYSFTWITPYQAQVFVAAENLLDRDYAYRLGYLMPGATWMAGIKLAF